MHFVYFGQVVCINQLQFILFKCPKEYENHTNLNLTFYFFRVCVKIKCGKMTPAVNQNRPAN
jgi:hypothetical protein